MCNQPMLSKSRQFALLVLNYHKSPFIVIRNLWIKNELRNSTIQLFFIFQLNPLKLLPKSNNDIRFTEH